MIDLLPNFPENVVAICCRGRVSKADYDSVLIPAVENALKKHEKVRIYYEIASDFAGFDPGAMFEDFKVGMGHLTRWERIALVADVEWIRHATQLFSVITPGETKLFPTSQAKEARAWIAA